MKEYYYLAVIKNTGYIDEQAFRRRFAAIDGYLAVEKGEWPRKKITEEILRVGGDCKIIKMDFCKTEDFLIYNFYKKRKYRDYADLVKLLEDN